jgi:hypothetical protein
MLNAWDMGRDVIFRDAPHMLIASAPRGASSAEADPFIALSYFELMAASLGLGTVWCGYARWALQSVVPGMCRMLGIPPEPRSMYAVMFGYPDVRYARTVQREVRTCIRVGMVDLEVGCEAQHRGSPAGAGVGGDGAMGSLLFERGVTARLLRRLNLTDRPCTLHSPGLRPGRGGGPGDQHLGANRVTRTADLRRRSARSTFGAELARAEAGPCVGWPPVGPWVAWARVADPAEWRGSSPSRPWPGGGGADFIIRGTFAS